MHKKCANTYVNIHTYVSVCTVMALNCIIFGFSRKRNDKAEVQLYCAYGRNFARRISVDRARKVLYRRNLLLPLYNDVYREFGPDRTRKSGQAVSHISYC